MRTFALVVATLTSTSSSHVSAMVASTAPRTTTGVSSKTVSLMSDAVRARPPVVREVLDPWREYDELRGGLDFGKLGAFFLRKPGLVAGRLAYVANVLRNAKADWETGTPDPAFADDGAGYQFDYVPEDEMDDGVRDESFSASERTSTDDDVVHRGVRLVEQMSSLGPVAVKICQTLSQRADIVGNEVCDALKRLQTNNLPFENDLAMAVIQESLRWDGPVAPGVGGDEGEPLFAKISAEPIAVASLGQVYKATLHDGREVAVKVQRPDGTALLSQDSMCFRVVLALVNSVLNLVPGRAFDQGLIGDIVERVARDMTDELDYYKEAESGRHFAESLRFLGFVRTPDAVPEYSTDRVLVTEFVVGAHLKDLDQRGGLAMTRMAVEACTASLVLTGLVHADPHEGNLMLDEHGNVVFLDFGLMSTVEDDVMEAFARGIQACLSEDWLELTRAFKDTGFINDPVQWKPLGRETDDFEPVGYDPVTGEDLGVVRLSTELGDAMRDEEGGTSRFGALATVLNKRLSARWKMATPPYVLLLIRTFLTLEGIAGRVDPDFNIYEMAMPWAVRRSLSPSTREGVKTLRNTLLTTDDRVRWSRLLELLEQQQQEAVAETEKAKERSAVAATEDAAKADAGHDVAKADAMNDAVVSLIGSPEGAVLRRLVRDVDSIDLVSRLLSKEGRPLRQKAVEALAARRTNHVVDDGTSDSSSSTSAAPSSRPVSEECRRLKERQYRWTRKVTRMLVKEHLMRQLRAGPVAWIRILLLSLKIGTRVVGKRVSARLGGLFGNQRRGTSPSSSQ